MSAEAQASLQQLWEKLHFSTVKRTIAREPEDVLSIRVYDPTERWPAGHRRELFEHSRYKRLMDVPEELRPHAEISWRHYFGFTSEDIFFQQDDYHGLDLTIDKTMTWSRWGNHTGGYDRPEDGQMVCGEVIDTAEGKRFDSWFTCDEAFKLLVTIIREGSNLSEEELGRQLVTSGSWPDMYWGLARLVLFDNVRAFVDEYLPYEQKPEHPAADTPYGQEADFYRTRGMSLPGHSAEYVHVLSYRLKQPQWWKEFLSETARLDLDHMHYHWINQGHCLACNEESHARQSQLRAELR